MTLPAHGQSRVIIENVQPAVDHGRYPARRAVGEYVDVSADIFADGHDHIRAEIGFRTSTSSSWTFTEMHPGDNDRWHGSFCVPEKTIYKFIVQAWVDPLDTWWDGIKKKIAAQVDVRLELKEGTLLLSAMASPDAKKAAARLSDEKKYAEVCAWVCAEEFAEFVHNHPVRNFAVKTDREFDVHVVSPQVLFSSWYELFPRSASLTAKPGTFADVIRLLPRIQSMGFDVLYLPPIHPIGKVNRKGKNNNVRSQPGEPGSPWAIGSDEGGHKAVHPELGSLKEYVLLIEEANKRGMRIALDLAFQCAPDHPYVKEYPQWFKQRPDGSIQYAENPPKKYQDIYPFYFECDDWQALWNELKSVVVFWIEQGVTVFRVDNPHTKPIPFWEWLIAEVHRQHTDVVFLSEAFTKPKVMASLAKAGFSQSYTYFTWRVHKQELINYMMELVHSPSRNYFWPNFWPTTPDILPYHLQHQGENSFIIRLALAATLSSNYGIYGPAYEFCVSEPIPGKEEFLDSEKFEIKSYDWKRTNRMTDIMTLLNRARAAHPALQTTWNIHFCAVENNQLLAYLKYTRDLTDLILVVVNLDPHHVQNGYVQLPLSLLKLHGNLNLKLHDLATDERYTWTQEWNYVELNPHKMPFHLFSVTLHESFV
jgi:starch synthase (maltosyl-transferring)